MKTPAQRVREAREVIEGTYDNHPLLYPPSAVKKEGREMATSNKPAPPKAPTGGIRRVAAELMPITVMVHGFSKAGKTHFAGTFPTPLFAFVRGEQGTHTLPSLKRDDIFQVPVGSLQDLEAVLKQLPVWIKEFGIRTFVVDTGSLLGSLLAVKAGEYGNRKMDFQDWARIKGAFLNTRDVVTGLGLHLVWVMHTTENRDDDHIVCLEPLLVGRALNDIIPSCNIVAYLEKMTEEAVDTDAGVGKKNKKDTGSSPVEVVTRYLWVRCPMNAKPKFLCGTHFDDLLVEQVYEPDWKVLAKYLHGRVLDA